MQTSTQTTLEQRQAFAAVVEHGKSAKRPRGCIKFTSAISQSRIRVKPLCSLSAGQKANP